MVGSGAGAAGVVTTSPDTDASPLWTATAERMMAFESATHIALPTACWAARLPLGRAQVEGNPMSVALSCAVITRTVLPLASHHVNACPAHTAKLCVSTGRMVGPPLWLRV